MWEPGTAKAIGRSSATYLRDGARFAAMRELLSHFVGPGSLAFDIGAHLGDRSVAMADLGARVVALEPQPAPHRAFRLIHRRDPRIALLGAAIGARPGRAEMRVNGANPTVSTLSGAFVAAAAAGPGWRGQVWSGRVEVEVTTLDALIAAHGRPDFVKIDVEGHEAAALAGLTAPLPAISFEVTSLAPAVGLDCIDRLETLGRYRYALSLGESHALEPAGWIGPAAMRARLARLDHAENSGDVYARLIG